MKFCGLAVKVLSVSELLYSPRSKNERQLYSKCLRVSELAASRLLTPVPARPCPSRPPGRKKAPVSQPEPLKNVTV